MKCPSCTRDHKHSYGMKCNCGYVFALDPKIDGISDRRFVSFINRASSNGTFRFTENQLYTEACRKQLDAPFSVLGLFAVMVVGFVIAAIVFDPMLLVLLLVPTIGTLVWAYWRYLRELSRSKFEGWLKTYVSGQGPIENMITPGGLVEPPSDAVEPDIYDYGVERILFVERPLIVDLLIANNVHMTNRAVIVTTDGYPAYIEPIANRLLEESPELPVFLLHDATNEGMLWAADQTTRFMSLKRELVDIGLKPESFKRIKKVRSLRLRKQNWQATIDTLPMAMLAEGISLSLDLGIEIEELLVNETSSDSTASFG